jgi:hypothetical protein
VLMLLPRFRRPRLCPDVVSDGPSNEVFTPEESSQPPGPRLAAGPLRSVFIQRTAADPSRPASQFTDICIQEEIR